MGGLSKGILESSERLSGASSEVGWSIGLVMRSAGTSSSVSKTKKASPASPIFMLNGIGFPLTNTFTFFSLGRKTCHFPNRT